jgi:hypothetical protein
MLTLPMLFGAFQSPSPHRAAPPATVFPLGPHCPINPEFKNLAQTWGWKMITVHEKMYP